MPWPGCCQPHLRAYLCLKAQGGFPQHKTERADSLAQEARPRISGSWVWPGHGPPAILLPPASCGASICCTSMQGSPLSVMLSPPLVRGEGLTNFWQGPLPLPGPHPLGVPLPHYAPLLKTSSFGLCLLPLGGEWLKAGADPFVSPRVRGTVCDTQLGFAEIKNVQREEGAREAMCARQREAEDRSTPVCCRGVPYKFKWLRGCHIMKTGNFSPDSKRERESL